MTDSDIHLKDPFSVSAQDLTEGERFYMANLNDKLTRIEKKIKETSTTIESEVQRTTTSSGGWLGDYEIECIIIFCLKKDDPGYVENDDNILVVLTETVKKKTWDWGIADGNNHNEFRHLQHPMRDEYHCWLYHCLYDHTELGWANILRIGYIWVDIQIAYQHIEDTDSLDCNL